MGQRHQIFVIARVRTRADRPPHYRCIAALHHQFCYGRLPLARTNEFKHLARREDNAFLIQAEIASYLDRVTEKSIRRPCPYTSFLAESAFSTDVSKGNEYFRNIIVLDANMGSNQGDNNDGITVLDVTIPGKPAYCFVSVGGLEGTYGRVPRMIPLTATQYLRAYRPVPKEGDEEDQVGEAKNLELIADLDDMPLIKLEALQEVWRTEYTSPGDDDTPDLEPEAVLDVDLKQLRLCEDSLGPSSILPALKRKLQLTPEDISLLVTVLNAQTIDLSGFSLTSSQLTSVLGELSGLHRLDISGIKAVDKDMLVLVLKAHTSLRWINLDRTSVSMHDFKDLLTNQPELFHHLEGIIHPAFLAEDSECELPSAFRVINLLEISPYLAAASVPFFTTDQIVQNLTNLIAFHDTENPEPTIYDWAWSINIASIFASSLRGHGQEWRDRDIYNIPKQGFRGFQGRGYSFLYRPGHPFQLDFKQYGILRFKKRLAADISCGSNLQTKVSRESEGMEVIDMATFLKELEEVDGRAPPSSPDAAKHLVQLSEKMKLIDDPDAFLQDLMKTMSKIAWMY